MTKTLLIVGLVNLTIACTNSQPLLLKDSLKVTNQTNLTKRNLEDCRLERFLNLRTTVVNIASYKQNSDFIGYIKKLEETNHKMVAANRFMIKELMSCLES